MRIDAITLLIDARPVDKLKTITKIKYIIENLRVVLPLPVVSLNRHFSLPLVLSFYCIRETLMTRENKLFTP